MRFVLAVCLVVIVSLSTFSLAGSPPELDYQGKILIDNIPLNGDGYFKFAIAGEDGATNFWANDGTGAGEPAAFVTNDCFNGVFDTILGASPMDAIDPTFFGFDTSLFLRVWFSPDGVSFNEMLPQQELVSAPSALNADMVDGYHAAELISIATNSVTLSGDISGTPGDGTTVDSLQGGALDLGAPGAGEVLTWDGSAWTNAPSDGMSPVVASNSFVRKSGDTMTGALDINSSRGLTIGSFSNEVEIGNAANGANSGTAVGAGAWGALQGVAVGLSANGAYRGVAVGANSDGTNYGVAVGSQASAPGTNIAIGVMANAAPNLMGSFERIAIGHEVTNEVDNSIRVRGDLYLDGGFSIYSRSPFGVGAFTKILPLPLLDRVVFVSPTSKKPWATGSVDDPFGDMQNAYTFASAWHIGEPATLVICGGNYTNGLNMSGGNVHVVGLDRPQILNLTVTAAANSMLGKQRVHNLIVKGATVVAVDAGADVKFHNCRFEGGLQILGPNVEAQDCFATVMDGTAVTVGSGGSPIANVALYNSSFQNVSAVNPTVLVNANVNNFEIMGCHIVNNDNGPCVDDMEPGPLSPTHLYTHNYLRGMPPGVGTTPALRDPVAGATGPTITFVQNTVMGHVGLNSNMQYYAQNIVYGIINNVGGGGFPGWSQAGVGTGMDPSGNIEHELVSPSLPGSWLD